MKKIEHFILPENTNSLYKEEAISSIALTKEVADKINELVDAYNDVSACNLEKHHELEGYVRKGVIFMKDNLVNSLHDLFKLLQESGDLTEILSDAVLSDLSDVKAKTQGIYNVKMFGAMGDGVSDDTKAIKLALETAYLFGGGDVVIPTSNEPYIFTEIVIPEGVNLIGSGGRLKLKDNVCVKPNKNYYLIHNGDGAGNVTIDGLVIDGNKEHNTQFKVADIITVAGDNVKVVNCKIMNPPDSGIMFSCAENSVCSNNYISGAPDCGIYINNNGRSNVKMGSMCCNNTIIDCYTGIAMKRIVQHMVVCENMIRACDYGITHENASSDFDFATDTMINNNMIIDVALTGIILRGSKHTIVQGNYISGFKYAGIELQGSSNNTISGNTISSVIEETVRHGAGIYVVTRANANLPSNHNVISGNTFDIEYSGETYHFSYILIEGTVGINCYHNIVSSNTGTGTVKRGITLSKCRTSQLINNIFTGAELFGVLSENVGTLLQNNMIDGDVRAIYDMPIIGKTPFGQTIYTNHVATAPNIAANQNDICLAKTPATNGCIGWLYNNGWVPFGEV